MADNQLTMVVIDRPLCVWIIDVGERLLGVPWDRFAKDSTGLGDVVVCNISISTTGSATPRSPQYTSISLSFSVALPQDLESLLYRS